MSQQFVNYTIWWLNQCPDLWIDKSDNLRKSRMVINYNAWFLVLRQVDLRSSSLYRSITLIVTLKDILYEEEIILEIYLGYYIFKCRYNGFTMINKYLDIFVT